MNYRLTEIHDLAHFDPAIASLEGLLDLAFAESHSHCGEGFALNDRAVSLRSFALSRLDGALVPSGVILAVPGGIRRPFGTTWLDLPTTEGVERVMVNCIKPLDANRFKLTHGNPSAISDFIIQPGLWRDEQTIQDLLIGINGSLKPKERGHPLVLRVRAWLLGGYLDRTNHVFHAVDQRYILDGEYGGNGGGTRTPMEPTGPTPQVARP